MEKAISGILSLVFAMLPLSAQAGRFGRHGGPPPEVMKQVLKDAGLSDQQIRRLENLRLEAEKQALDIRHEMQKERLELARLMQAEKPDRNAIFKQLEKISALQLQLKKNRVGSLLDARAEMTPEQWEKVQKIFFEMKRQHHEGPGQHEGCPGNCPHHQKGAGGPPLP
jgi:Spy/CpxP family protein refolding chaperone